MCQLAECLEEFASAGCHAGAELDRFVYVVRPHQHQQHQLMQEERETLQSCMDIGCGEASCDVGSAGGPDGGGNGSGAQHSPFNLGMTFIGVNQTAYVRSVDPGSHAAMAGIRERDAVQFAFVQRTTSTSTNDGGGGVGAAGMGEAANGCGGLDFLDPDSYGCGHMSNSSGPFSCVGVGSCVTATDEEVQEEIVTRYALECERQGMRTSYADFCDMFPYDITCQTRALSTRVIDQQVNPVPGATSGEWGVKQKATLDKNSNPTTSTTPPQPHANLDFTQGYPAPEHTTGFPDDDALSTGSEVSQWSETSHLGRLSAREKSRYRPPPACAPRVALADNLDLEQTPPLEQKAEIDASDVQAVIIVFRRAQSRQRLVCPCETDYLNIPFIDFMFFSLGTLL